MASRRLQLLLLEEQLIIEQQICCLLLLLRRRRRRRKRRWCVRPSHSMRRTDGEYNLLVKPMMRSLDEETHFSYFRMSAHRFDDLLHRISPYVRHGRTHHSPVTLPERLAVTLRVLASGSTQKSVAAKYKLGSSTVSLIVSEVCRAIWKALEADFVSEPKDHEWADIAREFWSVWKFPSCLGCVGVKPVRMKATQNAERDGEGAPSIVLMAACDAKYRFTVVDVGSYGRQSDGGVFQKSAFGSRLLQGTLDLPRPENLPGTTVTVPHFFLGDTDLPLHVNMMRPYQGNNLDDGCKLYNDRHSGTRRVIDDAFGILAARWRILGRPVDFHPDKTVDVVRACVALHNMLVHTDAAASPACRYIPPGFADAAAAAGDLQPGGWSRLEPGPPFAAGDSQAAVAVRDDLNSFFQTPQGLVL